MLIYLVFNGLLKPNLHNIAHIQHIQLTQQIPGPWIHLAPTKIQWRALVEELLYSSEYTNGDTFVTIRTSYMELFLWGSDAGSPQTWQTGRCTHMTSRGDRHVAPPTTQRRHAASSPHANL